MEAQVVDEPEQRRFSLRIAEHAYAAAYYREENDALVLIHTQVPSEYNGQGWGTRLAIGAFELMRASGRRAILRCPFMVSFFARHPEYADVVAG
jgi:predicted GNAT family acetyltransferase